MPSDDERSSPPDDTSDIRRCDYCRLPIPGEELTRDHDGVTYTFCSEACRSALDSADKVFTEYHGFRRLKSGVSALDASLPEGIPRNSFVMLTDLAGTRSEADRKSTRLNSSHTHLSRMPSSA